MKAFTNTPKNWRTSFPTDLTKVNRLVNFALVKKFLSVLCQLWLGGKWFSDDVGTSSYRKVEYCCATKCVPRGVALCSSAHVTWQLEGSYLFQLLGVEIQPLDNSRQTIAFPTQMTFNGKIFNHHYPLSSVIIAEKYAWNSWPSNIQYL